MTNSLLISGVFLQIVNLKLFCQFWKSKQKQIHVWDLYKTSKSAKNWSSIFGLIEETMDLSCILLTVQWSWFFSFCALFLFVSLRSVQINHFFMIHCCSKGQGESDKSFLWQFLSWHFSSNEIYSLAICTVDYFLNFKPAVP